ncbi:hypothetical protein AYL99_12002 [Fonsecaea erecta]|uniref:Conserved oligomeric Golgi complex subunit 6 n=1 Tax=Fonsecaea erecta TaxID=1367422 RepID=A0A178Z3K0_9EURO|nr:hypothetical protein AYL99_12002 [Fonsecaea erecta]OAP53783.1 hypothetical protein AYL99_12002 [Fonsecaea erecta]
MKSHILAVKQESRPMIEGANSLLKRKRETKTKEQLFKVFTAHFLVSDEELDVLTNPAVENDERLFVALARVKKVHADCSVLLVYMNLQSRVDITVRTGRDPMLTFKFFNLLDFHRGILAQLQSCRAQTLQASTLMFSETALKEEISAAVASTDAEAVQELTPPAFLATVLSQFSKVCRVRGPRTADVELERLYTVMLSGMASACGETAARITDTRQRTIYQINYMTALRSALVKMIA